MDHRELSARELSALGGKARAKKLSAERRHEIAKLGAKAKQEKKLKKRKIHKNNNHNPATSSTTPREEA